MTYPSAPHDTGRGHIWLRPELIGRPAWVIFIVTMMLGPSTVSSAYYGLTHHPGDFLGLFTDHHLLGSCVIESVLLGLLLLVLHRRGWRPADLRIRPGFRATAQGIGLFFVSYLVIYAVWLGLGAASSLLPHAWATAFLSHAGGPPTGAMDLSWPVLIGLSALNPFFEETVYMSFIFNQVAARCGANWAVWTTVLIRLAIHTYQGIGQTLYIGVFSLSFALFYRKRGNVWPLIFAHFLMDLIGLSAAKAYSSR